MNIRTNQLEWKRPGSASTLTGPNHNRNRLDRLEVGCMQSTDKPLPPWESIPIKNLGGRTFDVRWMIGSDVDAVHYVYEIYERGKYGHADKSPMYVGRTRSLTHRWAEHKRLSWWFCIVEPLCIILSGYASKDDAKRAEAALIQEYQPALNTKPERAWLSPLPVESLFTAELTLKGRR